MSTLAIEGFDPVGKESLEICEPTAAMSKASANDADLDDGGISTHLEVC